MNFLDFLINQGMTRQDLIMLLSAPILILLITFSRQMVGLRGFGLFIPLLMIYGLFEIGLIDGTIVLALITLISTVARYLLRHLRILYFPRIALILTLAVCSIFLIYLFSYLFDFPFNFKSPILAILAIAVFGEKLVSIQIEQDLKTSFILTLETLFVVFVGFFLVSQPFFQKLILANPWILMIGSIALILSLGRWSGLRILEYIRFWQIINK